MSNRPSLSLYNSLFIAILLAAASAGVTLLDLNVPVLRTVLALLLVFILPGYALIMALFPGDDLGLARLALFSVGGSIALAIVGGFLLNLTPLGLQARSWAILLAGEAIALSLVALLRHAQPRIKASHLNIGLRQGVMLAAALVIVIAAVLIAQNGVAQQPTEFTQLWMLPVGTQNVELGVRNMESTPMQYKLQLLVNNAVVQEWPTIDLASSGQWQETLALRPEWAAASAVDAVLYRLDEPNVVYRRTWLQHNGQGAAQ